MDRRLTDAEKVRRLPWMVAGDTLTSMFCAVTVFGSSFMLFLRELGLDSTRIGLVVALIPLGGILAPLIAGPVARFGFKRTFVTFWGLRKIAVALLLLTPLILRRWGDQGAFVWIGAVVLIFALCRGIAETGFYPWIQEAIPNAIRGKFGAINSIVYTLGQIVAVAIAGLVVDRYTGLGRFMALIGGGVVLGLVAVWTYTRVPGDSVPQELRATGRLWKSMRESLGDPDFRAFLAATGLVTLGGMSLLAFVPLYVREHLGLSAGSVVTLSIGTYAGALLSSYLWGWSSDRYGSKPVVLTGLYAMLLLPVCWFLIPRSSHWSLPLAMMVAFLGGLSGQGWSIGWNRYLFVTAIPANRKTIYMPVYYAWSQLVSGVGPLVAGVLLDALSGWQGNWGILELSPHDPLFALSFLSLVVGVLVVGRLRSDGDLSLGRFASLFWRGNPVLAAGSLLRHRRAGNEERRLVTAAQMGEARNLLSMHELLEALSDPSLNVRHEAILAIARLRAEPELVDALVSVLEGSHLELRLAAAWALGRMDCTQSVAALRRALDGQEPLLRARSARSLGMLGDRDSIPVLRQALHSGDHDGECLAYAAALGALGDRDAVADILALLRQTQGQEARDDLSLAVARILGPEADYVRLWRAFHGDLPAAAASALLMVRALAAKTPQSFLAGQEGRALVALLEESTKYFTEGEISHGTLLLGAACRSLSPAVSDRALAAVLDECAASLAYLSSMRREYLVLGCHALRVALETAVATRSPLAQAASLAGAGQ